MNSESPIPEQGGCRELRSFRIAQLLYDVTVRFCNRYIEINRRLHYRMVQSARSGAQNIMDGCLASATSKTTELELTRVARESMDTLRLDYEAFLRQHNMPVWSYNDRRRKALSVRQCTTVDEVALWVLQENTRSSTGKNLPRPSIPNTPSVVSIPSTPEITANAAITLIILAGSLLDRKIGTLEKYL